MNLTSAATSLFGSSQHDPLSTLDLSPVSMRYPFYHLPRPSILPWISDKNLSLLAPVVVYWVVSLTFHLLDILQLPFFEKYRLHEPEEVTKRNRVSVGKVVRMVILQQAVQTVLGILVLEDEEVVIEQVFVDHKQKIRDVGVVLAKSLVSVCGTGTGMKVLSAVGRPLAQWLYWWGIPLVQFVWAFLVMDAWQYFLHRAFHQSRFLYRHFHSHHHRLYVPYAFGALYNHPLEGLLLDSAGAAIAHAAAFMTLRQGIVLFAFSTLKTVDDHGGYALPWYIDPLHLIFPNTAEYHDVHHQMQGLRYNYSQPFFIHFDVLFGTRMSAEKFAKLRAKKDGSGKGEANGAPSPIPAPSSDDVPASSAHAEESAISSGKETPQTAPLRQRAVRANGSSTSPSAPTSGLGNDPTVTTSLESYRAKAGTVGA